MSRIKKRSRNFGPVADNHGNGHRFTDSTSESEQRCTQQPGFPVSKNYFCGFPFCCSQSQCSFTLGFRNCLENITRNRGNNGKNHNSKNNAGRKHSETVRNPLKERQVPKAFYQIGLDGITQPWHQDKYAPESVDDTGNSCK